MRLDQDVDSKGTVRAGTGIAGAVYLKSTGAESRDRDKFRSLEKNYLGYIFETVKFMALVVRKRSPKTRERGRDPKERGRGPTLRSR